jgi:beta-lactamase class A
MFEDLNLGGGAYAAPLDGPGVGFAGDELVTPASVMKIQIALAGARDIAAGRLNGREQRILSSSRRTPGPAGISLLQDEVRMSVRDLLSQMLTISDNVATDELIGLIGLDRVNTLTASLGLTATTIVSDLSTMLDDMAVEAGYADYLALESASPSNAVLHPTAALDPARGSRTTAVETVRLLQSIWTSQDEAAAVVRAAMSRQLTRHRIASAFGPEVSVAAKSGGLMGLVRNEAGVVTYPNGARYAVAVFTRVTPDHPAGPGQIDAAIGQIARTLIETLRS